MSEATTPKGPLEQAWSLLQEKRPTLDVLALVEHVTESHPDFPKAQHLRGACAMREGDDERAKALLLDAIRRGERSGAALMQLVRVAATLGMPDDAQSLLLDLLRQAPGERLLPFAVQVAQTLSFADRLPHPRKDAAFEKILTPILSMLLDRRQMDDAIRLEGLLYEFYIKPTETEAHFAWCMERIAPLFTKAAHALRGELAPAPQPALAPPYRIGFFIHNASTLAHIDIILKALKGYRMLDEQPFEPVVYCFGGKSPEMEQALAELNVRLVMLNEQFPETEGSSWRRLLSLRDLLLHDGVQELVWVSLVTMMPLAFGLRLAPVQTWFAMKYKTFSHEDIDGYVMVSRLTRFSTLSGRRWRTAMGGLDDWYDVGAEALAAAIRAPLNRRVILMTLGRTEKMQDPAYLQAITSILATHPETFFMWAGREESPLVVDAFRKAGVLERTRFIGWVDTRLYAQVADIFLDSFPFPCGHTLFQAMAAGKPVVIYDSPEAAQSGLWMFIKPVIEDGEGTDEERAELRAHLGDDANPLIPVARTPQDYVRHASRLIRDVQAREASGDASRRMIDHYFSDPKTMGSSLARHFMELIEERSAASSI